jgi:hypothetical protein
VLPVPGVTDVHPGLVEKVVGSALKAAKRRVGQQSGSDRPSLPQAGEVRVARSVRCSPIPMVLENICSGSKFTLAA